jgi:hypothetical protein
VNTLYVNVYETEPDVEPPTPVEVLLYGWADGRSATAGKVLKPPPPVIPREPFSTAGAAEVVALLSQLLGGEPPMTLQDELRGEVDEVSDTGTLLTSAADRIDELEALLAGSGDPARIAELEDALVQITAIIEGVSV